MISNASIVATLPAANLGRAREFYEKKLGLKVTQEDPSPGMLLQSEKGGMIYVYQREPTKADHTAATFVVDDVESEVRDLKSKGIEFEEIDIPARGIKTVNSIATMDSMKGAWFKDTEGNILGLTQMSK